MGSSVDEKKGTAIDHRRSPSRSESDLELNGVNETALLRKLDLRLLPAVSLLYLLSFLDRSNGALILLNCHYVRVLITGISVANARLDGLTTDLHMSKSDRITSLNTLR